MERAQHLVQDTAEVYAVARAQEEAERLGVAATATAGERRQEFLDYLHTASLTEKDFASGLYGKYKRNVDMHIPAFVARLAEHFPGETLDFVNDEAAMRVQGLKGDFLVRVGIRPEPIRVSLKNYTGGGGIRRPQVSSGTYLSFANGFVFDRVGVGLYADPREPTKTFLGRDRIARNSVLAYERRKEFIDLLDHLESLQREMRQELLSPDCVMYDQQRVRSVVDRIAQPGITTVLHIFDLLGIDKVREKFLQRVGLELDGQEESLFFDADQYVDSITNRAYHEFRERINSPDTEFHVAQHKQSLRFSFAKGDRMLLKTDVPFTINTNGAWFRPRERYEGTRPYQDKGHVVDLAWGQRRPYKSLEIATSTNTYLDLAGIGIFRN